MMLSAAVLKALVLEPLKNDLYSLNVKSNVGVVEIKFDDDDMIIKLKDIANDLGAELISNGYQVSADTKDGYYIISIKHGKSNVKTFKKFLKIYKRFEKKVKSKE